MNSLLGSGSRTAALVVFYAIAGCRTPGPSQAPSSSGTEEERLWRAVDARLRAAFPEVTGEITRESIQKALLESVPSDPADADVPAAAIAAIQRGDFDLARGLLGELVTKNEVARARELLARGERRQAVTILDHAVRTAPDSAELRIMRGDAELTIALESNERAFAELALEDYREAAKKRGGARASLGASRAAHFLGQHDEALRRAREGIEQLAGANLVLPLGATPERVLAEATLSAQSGVDARLERTALFSTIARAPEDPWAWRALSIVELESGDAEASRRVAEHALASFPDDADLHDALATALSRSHGRASVIREYERFTAAHPASAEGHWKLGVARLEGALEALAEKRAEPAAFTQAEADFNRCRETLPSRSSACARRVATARTGLGWAHLSAGDTDRARDAFLSVEDAAKGLAAESLVPGMPSALEGLAAVGARYLDARSGAGGPSQDNLEKAARVFDFVNEYDRSNAKFAVLAASANRDAAVALEIDARSLCASGRKDEANLRLSRAREMMERSLAAWKAALELTPADAKSLREAGRVLVDYLQRDAGVARGWLELAAGIDERRAAEIKTRGTADKSNLRELEEVESNLSDAYRTLGVLELTLEKNPATALVWFEKCLDTGPDPSEEVSGTRGWLARCRAALEAKRDPPMEEADRWAAPC